MEGNKVSLRVNIWNISKFNWHWVDKPLRIRLGLHQQAPADWPPPIVF